MGEPGEGDPQLALALRSALRAHTRSGTSRRRGGEHRVRYRCEQPGAAPHCSRFAASSTRLEGLRGRPPRQPSHATSTRAPATSSARHSPDRMFRALEPSSRALGRGQFRTAEDAVHKETAVLRRREKILFLSLFVHPPDGLRPTEAPLTTRAKHGRPLGHQTTLQPAPASETRLPGAAVHPVVSRKHTGPARGVDVVAQRRSAGRDRMTEDRMDGRRQLVHHGVGKRRSDRAGVNSRGKEHFVHVDVPQSRNQRLIEQRALDRSRGPAQSLPEGCGIHRQCVRAQRPPPAGVQCLGRGD